MTERISKTELFRDRGALSYPPKISQVLVSKRGGGEAQPRLSGGRASVWSGLALSIASLVAVTALAAANGAYFPTSWGWAAVAFAWIAVVGVVVRGVLRLSRFELSALAGLLGLTGWTWLSVTWSQNVTGTVLEAERSLVYLTALLSLFLVVRSRSVARLLAGTLGGIALVSAYALTTRLFPERIGHYSPLAGSRLATPVGYWNALGLFAAMGCLLALGFASRGRGILGRALAAATLPVLLPTLYFTYSRGAWIALGVGLLAALALDTRRLQLISTLVVVAPAPAVAVLIASRSHALTGRATVLADAMHAGHRLAPIILGLAFAGGVAAGFLELVERRLPPLTRARVAYGAAVWVALALGLSALIAAYGSPWTIARKGYDSFKAPSISVAPGQSLNERLFSFSGNGRFDLWRIARKDATEHPWLGSGAGTYEQYWLLHRPYGANVRDAHNLYLETLAELGPPGLGLLAVVLALPLVAAVRIRRRRLTAMVFGAYVAYLVHAAADWDWELPAVTLTALFCGAALLISARSQSRTREVSLPLRALIVAVTVAAGAFAFVGLISNSALSASNRATLREDWPQAEAEARKAIRWAPWSSEGWRLLGEADLQQAKLVSARVSFRKAIAKDRGDWNLWLDLALASEGKARRAAASAALRLNPHSQVIAQIRPLLGLGKG
jgi:O-antigen ligase/polysaccharide polymerase Wzy-like membrane protein